MVSTFRSALLVVSALSAAACGQLESPDAQPLLFELRVELARSGAAEVEGDARMAVLWYRTHPWQEPPEDPETEPFVQDVPYVPGSDLAYRWRFDAPPDERVLSGRESASGAILAGWPEGARVAFGVPVAYEDRDGDGALQVSTCQDAGDPIIAANPEYALAWVEGGVPDLGVDGLRLGYSALRVDSCVVSPVGQCAPPEQIDLLGADEVVTLPVTETVEGAPLACPSPTLCPAPLEALPQGAVAFIEGVCGEEGRTFDLATSACAFDRYQLAPDQAPPPGWPCWIEGACAPGQGLNGCGIERVHRFDADVSGLGWARDRLVYVEEGAVMSLVPGAAPEVLLDAYPDAQTLQVLADESVALLAGLGVYRFDPDDVGAVEPLLPADAAEVLEGEIDWFDVSLAPESAGVVLMNGNRLIFSPIPVGSGQPTVAVANLRGSTKGLLLDSSVFWLHGSGIQRYRWGGGAPEWYLKFPPDAEVTLGQLQLGLADHVWWRSGNPYARERAGILRAGPGGEPSYQVVLTGTEPSSLAAADDQVYWLDRSDGTLNRVAAAGGEREILFRSAEIGAGRVVVSPSHIYWHRSEGGSSLMRMPR